MSDVTYLLLAIEESTLSVQRGGFPVGAILVGPDGEVIRGQSHGKALADPTSHAEIVAIRSATSKIGHRSLRDYVLYVSMQPCLMCYGASFWASIPRIVYAVPKERLTWQHSEGMYDLAAVNRDTRRPLQLVHIAELEPQASKVIQTWEQTHAVPVNAIT